MTCNDHGNCTLGSTCAINSECSSGKCSSNKCAEFTCGNSIQDSDETDIDCGGVCGRCQNNKECSVNSDCLSSFCDNGICKRAGICDDGILNGDETGIDCGGVICENRCSFGRTCNIDVDCGSSLVCLSGVCTGSISDQDIVSDDIDGDGIPDEWELDNGLDPSDPSDATLDFDNDGIINIREYTLGTNPNRADSDGDGTSDREEIELDTLPTDPVSKPGGIGGLLIWTVVIIMILGAGSYAVYYYKDYFIKPEAMEPIRQSFIGAFIPQQKPAPKKVSNKTNVHEIVKKRREQKEEKREKLFEAFGKKINFGKASTSPKKGKNIDKKPQHDVFSKLKNLSKK